MSQRFLVPLFFLPLLSLLPFLTHVAFADDNLSIGRYVSNLGEDVYIVKYQQTHAYELKGCKQSSEVIKLLNLPTNTPLREELFLDLEANFSLTKNPSIPCPGTASDVDIPWDASLWIDLNLEKKYFIEFPKSSGTFYSIPSACKGLKDAFNLRKRLTIPGALQGESKPNDTIMKEERPLLCGSGEVVGPSDPQAALATLLREYKSGEWRLFKGEAVIGENFETIYLATYEETLHGKNYRSLFPIQSIDGTTISDLLWEGDPAKILAIEDRLKKLFGLSGLLSLEAIPSNLISEVSKFPLNQLCLDRCQDATLTLLPLPPVVRTKALDGSIENRLGASRFTSSCAPLLSAMKARPNFSPILLDKNQWLGNLNTILADTNGEIFFRCPIPLSDHCIRQLKEGETLTASMLKAQNECRGKKRLTLLLKGMITTATPLFIDSTSGFSEVEILGHKGTANTLLPAEENFTLTLATTPGNTTPGSSCLFDKKSSLLTVKDLQHFTIRNLTLANGSKEGNGAKVELILDIDNSESILEQLTIEKSANPLRICKAEVYATSDIHWQSSKVMAVVSQGKLLLRNGDLLSDQEGIRATLNSAISLHSLELKGREIFRLDRSDLFCNRLNISNIEPGSRGSVAIRLNKANALTLKYASVSGFDYITYFAQKDNSIAFLLPTNDLKSDNRNLFGGEGKFDIIE
ncbi:MAG: hypothetical protein HQK50_07730 [Oligoflexia bacterium]|nr:hypothetical protein [Oligoflexia bacterium]